MGAISEGSKNNLKYMGLDNIQKLFQNFQLDIPQMEKIWDTFEDISER